MRSPPIRSKMCSSTKVCLLKGVPSSGTRMGSVSMGTRRVSTVMDCTSLRPSRTEMNADREPTMPFRPLMPFRLSWMSPSITGTTARCFSRVRAPRAIRKRSYRAAFR